MTSEVKPVLNSCFLSPPDTSVTPVTVTPAVTPQQQGAAPEVSLVPRSSESVTPAVTPQQQGAAPEVSLVPRSSESITLTATPRQQGTAPEVSLVPPSRQQEAAPEVSLTPRSTGSAITDHLSLTMLAQQLPPLPTFTGDAHGDKEEEEVKEWLERLEMMAAACGWSEQIKLVNLVTRLRGSAYFFYRSCTSQQQSSYRELAAALATRFEPVVLRSVRSGRFHERKQQPSESVDMFAQELKRLFHKAYPAAQQGSPEAQSMGRTVLASQFISGLHPRIKAKVAGVEGGFEELLVKARFEEARARDFGPSLNPPNMIPSRNEPARRGEQEFRKSYERQQGPMANDRPACFSCGSTRHFIRNFPRRGRGAPTESRGKMPSREPFGGVASVLPKKMSPEEKEQPPLLSDDDQSVIDDALSHVIATLHGVNTDGEIGEIQLGPTPTAEVLLEGTPIRVVLDTGSPVTIVSLQFLLQVLAGKRPEHQSVESWREEVKRRLLPPTISLRSYSGGALDVVSQIQSRISRGDYSVDAVLQVQNDAPVELLLGTDLQPHLGFTFMQLNGSQPPLDLLQIQETTPEASAGTTPPIVRLLQATRVPARHSKLVRAHVRGPIRNQSPSLILFEPSKELSAQGVTMTDGAVSPRVDQSLTLVVENEGFQPVWLKVGQVLGTLEHADLVEWEDLPEDEEPSEGVKVADVQVASEEDAPALTQVRAVSADSPELSWTERLLSSLGFDTLTLPVEEKKQLKELVLEFSDVFALDETELGSTDCISHVIDTGESQPIRQPPRRKPFALRRTIQDMVRSMLERGVIKPSHSPWSSPVVIVAKKDGSKRFCVDYRKLNAITKMDAYPLPRIDDALDVLSQMKYFTTLDLVSGYWQVKMSESSAEKTAFSTAEGLFEFVVMPFGLCNAPATFQRLMEAVLAGLIPETCLPYIDDVLVMAKTFDSHLERLRVVFLQFRNSGLKLKAKKCHLAQSMVRYLGYIVSEKGISADPSKVAAVREFPIPENLQSLRSFLGLASYYRRFIPCFSSVAHPLYALTKKDAPFIWTSSCEEAFMQLKQLLVQAPILAYPDFEKEFFVETDASGSGLGALLSQVQADGLHQPVAYASRTLQAHEKNYGVTELEALGVVWAARHFRPYLYGHRCTMITDHEALKALLNTPQPSGKLARWGMSLQELDVHIVYRPGRSNAKADALSRYPLEGEGSEVTMPFTLVASAMADTVSAKDGEPLSQQQRSDPDLRGIIEYLDSGALPADKASVREIVLSSSQYTLLDGVLYHVEKDKTLRIVPSASAREKLFHSVHDGKFGGHLRDAKVHGQLSRHYWWPGMRRDIREWCLTCIRCATRNVGRQTRPFLTPIPVAGPFDRVGMDIIQFPRSKQGNRYALVFVDYLTKWPEVFAISDQSAITVARVFVKEIVCRHGVPGALLSDRGAAFLSKLMLEVCRLMGVKKVNTTAYHPQTDGLVERFNRTLTDMLAKTVEAQGANWDERLPYVLFAYRTSLQQSTLESPFFLLYGRDAQLPLEEVMCPEPTWHPIDLSDYKMELSSSMVEAWEIARTSIKKAQRRQKQQHDRKARDPKFVIGDRVFVYMPASKSMEQTYV